MISHRISIYFGEVKTLQKGHKIIMCYILGLYKVEYCICVMSDYRGCDHKLLNKGSPEG